MTVDSRPDHIETVTMGVLGRIGIPFKVRKELGINDGDTLEMTVENGCIILRPKPSTVNEGAPPLNK